MHRESKLEKVLKGEALVDVFLHFCHLGKSDDGISNSVECDTGAENTKYTEKLSPSIEQRIYHITRS